MKRILMLAAAAICLCGPSLSAQQVTINEKSLLNKIERSDADIANPKKSGKASTWIHRGEVFYEVATAVSKHLYDGIDVVTLTTLFGEPTAAEVVELNGKVYTKGIFPYMDIYLDELAIPVAWIMTKEIYPGALQKSVEAYEKAYELDGNNQKTAEKVNEGLKQAYDEYSKTGALYFPLGMYEEAGNMFISAYEVAQMPGATISEADLYSLLHDAGLAFMLAQKYPQSIEYLTAAEKISAGNAEISDPEIYYRIYHAYRGNAMADPNAIQTAKQYLEKGMAMYPTDSKIIESLSEAYVFLGENPDNILTIVQQAAESDPTNADMWSALGVLYVSNNEYDKAIEAFTKMAELVPDSYVANNNLGIVYIKQAEAILEDVNSRAATFATQDEYDAELNKAFQVYAKAVPYLEKAYASDPTNVGTVELLKNVTFRIRDLDGMMAKYEKYNALFKSMTGGAQ